MRSLLAAIVSLCAAVPSFAQTTWYVDAQSCTGSGSGTASDPFCRIQQGIDAAGAGDTVLVLPGTYHESVLVPALDIRITGAGSAVTELNGRDYMPAVYVTQGARLELSEIAIRDGSPGLQAVGARVTLRACTFADNWGLMSTFDERGAGFHAVDSVIEVQSCSFEENFAMYGGGFYVVRGRLDIVGSEFIGNGGLIWGLEGGAGYVTNADVTIADSRLVDNYANAEGGALVVIGGTIVLRDSEIVDCGVLDYEGPVAIFGSKGVIEGCVFRDNGSNFGWGGALFIASPFPEHGTEAFEVNGCVFEGNRAADGGAVDVEHGHVRFADCVWIANEAGTYAYSESGYGGALFVYPPGAATLERCVFIGNESTGYLHQHAGRGGAVWGEATLRNCTLVGNIASGSVPGATGGAIAGGARLIDSIAWENLPDQLTPDSRASWSDIQGGWPGTGNFDADPMFWGPEHGDLRLLPGSPCIDAGHPSLTDDDGTRLDVGAFPFDAGYCGTPGAYCVAKESSAGCVPAIGWSGTLSVAGPDDFHVVATDVLPDALGILVWGTGASADPFHGGTLCIAPPRHRSPPLQASAGAACEGVFDFHFSHAQMQTHGLTAGDRVYFQFWYRDPLHGDGTGAGLTDALEAAVCLQP